MILCVYAVITASSSRIVATGIAGERLRAVTSGTVRAVVGELRRAPKPTMRNLRRYAGVIEGVAAQASAVLPVRFGTCVTDLDELILALRSRHDTLRSRLRAVRGRAQMTIRVVLGPESGSGSRDAADASQARVTASRARLANQDAASQGTHYLQQRATSAAAARNIPGFEPVRLAATRWIKDERIEKRAGVATVNHLVPRSSAAAYRAAVEQATDRAGLRVIVTGPHAPYAFADNW